MTILALSKYKHCLKVHVIQIFIGVIQICTFISKIFNSSIYLNYRRFRAISTACVFEQINTTINYKQKHRLAGADRSSVFLFKCEWTYFNTSVQKGSGLERGVYCVGVVIYYIFFKKKEKHAWLLHSLVVYLI